MYEFAIIGSGVSGGVIARELTAGGAKCVLIEAGKAFNRRTFPAGEMRYSTRMLWGGGIEVSRDARIAFLRGKCLGGTSVLNQALLNRFDDLAWDDWRNRSGVEFFSRDKMNPYYDAVLERIDSQPIPAEYRNRNAVLLSKAFDAAGLTWSPALRAQSDCRLDQGSDCIVCLGGCPRDAKQSTLVRGVAEARELGLVVETELEVERLVESADGVKVVGRRRGEAHEVAAIKVVLAGGALGNAAILLRSTDIAKRLPALGSAFCCHPQFMNYGLHADPVDAHKGAFSSVESHDDKLRRLGIKFENVAAPPIGTAMVMPGWGGAHHALMRHYRHLACLEFAIRDEPVGRLRLSSGGDLIRDKKLTRLDREKIHEGRRRALELLASTGAKRTIASQMAIGLHLMGGCPIGIDPRTSVVGPNFLIHGSDRLFAADSSVFPSAPGINPSFTIMALSIKASEAMLAH